MFDNDDRHNYIMWWIETRFVLIIILSIYSIWFWNSCEDICTQRDRHLAYKRYIISYTYIHIYVCLLLYFFLFHLCCGREVKSVRSIILSMVSWCQVLLWNSWVGRASLCCIVSMYNVYIGIYIQTVHYIKSSFSRINSKSWWLCEISK